MNPETASELLLILLMSAGSWALTNGGILLAFLWRRRAHNKTVQATVESTTAMCLNVACWCLIILTSVLWPTAVTPTTPIWLQTFTMVTFLIGYLSIGYALHRTRALWTGVGEQG